MEKISDILKPFKTWEPRADEYLHNGLIYCKECKTPRQGIYKNPNNGDQQSFPMMCRCRKEKYEAEEAIKKENDRAEHIKKLRQIGMPNPAYQTYTFEADDGQTPRTTQICKNFVDKIEDFRKFGGGLLLWGSVGTGKTFYAMCIANALIDKEYPVHCTTLAAIIKQAQDFDKADEHFNRLMRKKLIVIDDLGTERGTTFAHEQICRFIDGANTHNIPLIFTTNFSPSILTEATGDTTDLTYARIYSRILEKCCPIPVLDIKRRANNGTANYESAAAMLGLK